MKNWLFALAAGSIASLADYMLDGHVTFRDPYRVRKGHLMGNLSSWYPVPKSQPATLHF